MASHFEKIYLECECDSLEHTMVVQYDPQDGDCYVSVQLSRYGAWWQRAWGALKYVFGYQCKYGQWDCTLLDSSQLAKLRDVCDRAIVAKAEFDKKQ